MTAALAPAPWWMPRRPRLWTPRRDIDEYRLLRRPDASGELPEQSTSIQGLINAASSGGTVVLADGIYRQQFTVNKPLTLVATTPHRVRIDGRDYEGQSPAARQYWMTVSADDVTVRGIDFTHSAGTNTIGGIYTDNGVDRFLLDDSEVSYSYNNIIMGNGQDQELRDVFSHHGENLCVRIAGQDYINRNLAGKRNLVTRGRFSHGNYLGTGLLGDAGSLKVTGQDLFVFDGGEVFDNNSTGLWFDVWCYDSIVRNGRFHDNAGPGIFDETSQRTVIHDNVCWRNGDHEEWGFEAGICMASSGGGEVYNNLCAWNWVGIAVVDQTGRGDNQGVANVYVHDNIVCMGPMAAGVDHWGAFWAYDGPGPYHLYEPGYNNHGGGVQQFYFAYADGTLYPEGSDPYGGGRFIWDGYRSMASFQTTAGGAGSEYMTQAAAQAALTAAGVPLVP